MIYFLQAAPGGNSMYTFLMFGGMILVFYFFMIRPQMRKQKQEKTFQENLKRGDRVVTTSGIHGKVVELTDSAATIETGAGKIKFERSAISKEMSSSRYPKEAADKKEK